MKGKLIVSCGTLGQGGAERVLSILSHVFVSHFDEVIYLTWIDVPDFYEVDSSVYRVCVERESNSQNLMKKALWFRQFVKKESPSLVLSFLAPFNVLICYVLTGVDVPIVVCERNDPRHVWGGVLQKHIRNHAYRRAVGILQQTENNKAYFTGKLLAKTDVIYNPIIMGENNIGRALRTKKNKRIVSVARLIKQKNPEMLLKAFSIFRETHPDYTLTMYGQGIYRQSIETMVNQLGLSQYVDIPGAVNDVWDRIVDAECFVMSSWFEGMPNALLEAMCLGLPCVSTKVSGAVDLIDSGINGILVDLDDYNSLATAMNNIIDNAEFARQLGTEASKLHNLLNVDVISKQWISYIGSKAK